MKILKKLTYVLCILSLVLFVSCATNNKSTKPKLTKMQERMLWKISGTDKNGKESTIYVQGTIHLGDERLVVSDKVKKLFLSADRRIGEIASNEYSQIQAKTAEMMIDSINTAANKDFRKELSEKQNAFLQSVFQKEMLEQYALFEPCVINIVLTSSVVVTAGLDANKALDVYFINLATENNLDTKGLDTLQTQLDIIKFGNWDEQIIFLSETINSLSDDEEFKKATNEIKDLYESYIADDITKISELIDSSKENAKSDIEKQYNKIIWHDRNESWAKQIAQYLKDGGTTFIFAGAGHFVGKDSVFSIMQKNKQLELSLETTQN